MSVKCGDCRHFSPFMLPLTGEPDADPGSCDWRAPIPYAWRYCPREVMGVCADSDSDCPVFCPVADPAEFLGPAPTAEFIGEGE